MTPVFAFAISFVLLLAFFGFKVIEVRKGSRFLAPQRDAVDARVLAVVEKAQTFRVTDEHKRVVRLTLRYAAHQVVVAVLGLVRRVENRLAHSADVIRGKRIAVAHTTTSSSPFLETIVEHKNVMLKKVTARKSTRSRAKKVVQAASSDMADTFSMPIPQPE